MFPGQAGCFCCSDPPDPPPPCEECYYCGGDQPGCQNSVCDSYIIEVEGFANGTINPAYNQNGCNAIGTACGAYNGTFVLERDTTITVGDNVNCVYKSAEFTATVPIWLELNGQWCWECENVAVYYELRFMADFVGELVNRRAEIRLMRAIEGIAFASFRPNYDKDDPDGFLNRYFPAMPCNSEGISHLEQSFAWPLHMGYYLAEADTKTGGAGISGQAGLFGLAFTWGGGTWISPGEGLFLGTQFNFLAQVTYQGIADRCNITTQFDALPNEPGNQFMKIGSPNWVCCRDTSFDCDTVQQIATGALAGQYFPFWRINAFRCGT